MKKMFLALALAAFASLSMASENGAAITAGGGEFTGGATTLTFGTYPGTTSTYGFYGMALVNITKGDLLVGPLGSSITAKMGVSKTATAGDTTIIGVALATVAYGLPVPFATKGVVKIKTAVSTVLGTAYTSAATAGWVTPSSAVTATNYTSVSGNPTCAIALETRTIATAGDPALFYIRK